MKLNKDNPHYQQLKVAIESLLSTKNLDVLIDQYETGNIYNADKVKDLQKRFCFDLMYDATNNMWAKAISPDISSRPLCSFDAENHRHLIREIYQYANDDHIYTALKRICPKVTRKY